LSFKLLVIKDIAAYIDTTPTSTATYAQLGEGMENISEALNEALQQYFYLNNGGFAKNYVTGMAPAVTVTGHRVFGDTAQDYIFSKKYEIGSERESNLKLELTDENDNVETVIVPITICNIVSLGGATTDGSAISFELRFNEKPPITGGEYAAGLTVVSLAGSTSGKTAMYVNPALGAGNTYEYKTGSSVALPLVGVDPGATFTAWNGTDDIAAVTGNEIVIVEVDSGGLAVKAGKATVTSATE